jgi:hypothetical protein
VLSYIATIELLLPRSVQGSSFNWATEVVKIATIQKV